MSTVVAQEIIFIILFIFGCAWPLLPHVNFLELQRARLPLQLWCMGFSLQGLLLLQSLGSRGTGFGSCGHGGLSCPAAHGIFLDQGSNLYLLHWRADSSSYYYLIEG